MKLMTLALSYFPIRNKHERNSIFALLDYFSLFRVKVRKNLEKLLLHRKYTENNDVDHMTLTIIKSSKMFLKCKRKILLKYNHIIYL